MLDSKQYNYYDNYYDINKVSPKYIKIITEFVDSDVSDDSIIKYLTDKLKASIDVTINTLLFVKITLKN